MQQQTTESALLSSTQRPIPLRARSDLHIVQIEYRGVPFPVVKDPVGLKYYRLQPEQYAALTLLDGKLSLRQLCDKLLTRFPTLHVTPRDVQGLVTDLHEKGLLSSSRLGQGEQLLHKKQKETWKNVRQTLLNPLYLRLPGWDPEKTLQRIEPWFGWVFSKPAAIIFMSFVALSWLFVAIRFDDIRQRLPEFQQFFGWPNLIYLWLTMALAKILHEFGHGISCKHFGAECHSMGVMLLVFSPTLYCDVTDSWMLKDKWKRIAIGAAGMYVEMILAAFAIFIWYNTQPGMLNHLALNVFFVSTVTTVIFNANPLLRYDGYYMMADWLEIPNLRAKATKMLSQTFAWWCFGIEIPEDPFMPTSGKPWFILFSIASALYRWFVLFAITLFLYTVLKPYRLQSIGIMLAVGSLISIAIGMGINFYKMVVRPKQDPVSRLKVVVTCTVLVLLIAAVIFIPFPWYEEAAYYVEPVDVAHVYTAVPGFLEELQLHDGETVEAGDVIAVLKNPDLRDRAVQLDYEEQSQRIDPKIYSQLADEESRILSEKRLTTIVRQRQDLLEQSAHLTITAPISGRIIAPPRKPRPGIEQSKEHLSSWYGIPGNEANLGTYLEEQTHICSIAPTDRLRAIVLISQSDRRDLKLNDSIRLKSDHIPWRVWDGKVVEFSDRHLDFAPPALSNKFGGPLSTVSDAQGREKLTTPVYQAMVEFDQQPDDLMSGMRGVGRFVIAERTLFDWFWRWFRQTFHFRL